MKTLYAFTFALLISLLPQNEKLGKVSGEVIDMRGQPIAGARVVYTNIDNHKTYRVQTDSFGKFVMIGLALGTYDVEITRSSGQHIYTGRKPVFGVDKEAANVIDIDLSIVPPKTSLAPFLGVKKEELKKEEWSNVREDTLRDLTPEQAAELKKVNALISDYNEFAPQALAALKAQDWQKAAELLKKLTAIAPYKWELYQDMAITLRNLGYFEEAVQTFQKGIAIARDNLPAKKDRDKLNAAIAEMQMGEGEALVALGKPEAAASLFHSAAELFPDAGSPHLKAIAYLRLCLAEYNSNHGDAAVEACSTAVAADPGSPQNYQVLGSVLTNLERYKEAIPVYEKGIKLSQDSVLRLRPSAKSNINSRKFSDPAPAAAELVRMSQMMQSLGNVYFHLKNYPAAAKFFTQSAEHHPYPALPLYNLCATFYNMDDLSAAAAACNRAIEADAKVPAPYFVKGAALYGDAAKHGHYNASHEVTAALEKYLSLAPDGDYASDARAMLTHMNSPR